MSDPRMINTVGQYRHAIFAGPYAWPGGYPIYFLCDDGESLCFKCAKDEKRQIISAIADRRNDGWRIVARDINWEEPDLHCDHCDKQIESAYGKYGVADINNLNDFTLA